MWRRASAPVFAALLFAAACSVAGSGGPIAPVRPGVVRVVAAENFWGSIAAQIGGTHAQVTSIVTNPDEDPHAYEPTVRDAEALASAQLVMVNGVGYDTWASRLLAADGSSQDRVVVNVGEVLGLKAGANPHRWYNPDDVTKVAAAIAAGLARVDPADAPYFQSQRAWFLDVALRPYHQLVAQIRSRFSGTKVGASESIFAMLAPALGLDLITPLAFLRAVSEGTEPSAADKATIDRQIGTHQISVYVYNSQNTTPDIEAQLQECRAAGIPTATITETLTPPTATYEAWQVAELRGILSALEQGARR